MSIEVRNLIKNYQQQRVLHDISFKTQKNHIIGFLGPNGAGKSTTMKILTGILPMDKGECLIEGISITANPQTVKKIIGYLPENNPLYLDMYVKEILAYEGKLHQITNLPKRVEEVILLTGLQDEQHKKVRQLSKGYRQRVGLAMAIIHDPKVLILDEPTTGLDPNQIIEIRNLIKQLSVDKTVLLSTHLMQEVEAICGEIIVIHQGELKDQFLLQDRDKKYSGLTMEEIFVKLTA